MDSMDCSNLMLFWDGELPLEKVDAFQAHLLECRACLVELGALAQFDALAESHIRPKVARRRWWRKVKVLDWFWS